VLGGLAKCLKVEVTRESVCRGAGVCLLVLAFGAFALFLGPLTVCGCHVICVILFNKSSMILEIRDGA
jgi:hypothetical protein